jgi:amino-acid N-acetyltransferase
MIRKAVVTDVVEIQSLINPYAEKGVVLPRARHDLYDNLRDFFVYEENAKIKGVCALHISWEDLAEIRSLVVAADNSGKGIGEQLVLECLNDAKTLKINRVFALTYIPAYFERSGFRQIDKATLPHKIWHDCLYCVKFPNCDEQAVIIELYNHGKTFTL